MKKAGLTPCNPLVEPTNVPTRCGARTRSGVPCPSFAMPNGRCRMHGGKSAGPPRGSQNALKHGYFTADAISERLRVRAFIKECDHVLKKMV